MQEIKFRAWSKRDKCWVHGFCIHQTGKISDRITAELVMPQHIAIPDAHWDEEKEDLIIQQFTGLLDKQGKEIFEGDELLFTIFDRFDNGIPTSSEVYFDNGSFWVNYKNGGIDSCMELGRVIDQDDEIEIIGNIFEKIKVIPRVGMPQLDTKIKNCDS